MPRRQSCRWMNQIPQLASCLTLFYSTLTPAAWRWLSFPIRYGQEQQGMVESPQSPPLKAKDFLYPLGAEARLLWVSGSGKADSCICCSPQPLLSSSLPPSQVYSSEYTADRTVGSGGMAEGQVIHSLSTEIKPLVSEM